MKAADFLNHWLVISVAAVLMSVAFGIIGEGRWYYWLPLGICTSGFVRGIIRAAGRGSRVMAHVSFAIDHKITTALAWLGVAVAFIVVEADSGTVRFLPFGIWLLLVYSQWRRHREENDAIE